MNNNFIYTFYDLPFNIREATILNKLSKILDEIIIKQQIPESRICFISLYGSQNYELDNENSDIDCECFIFPSIKEIATCRTPYSTMITTTYGTCYIKDIRKAFIELNKSSPNMIELISSKYNIANKTYLSFVEKLCIHCNDIANADKTKFLKGLEGLFYKYSSGAKLNNKYYANALRMAKMIDIVLESNYYDMSKLLVLSDDLHYLKWLKSTTQQINDYSYLDGIVAETNKKLDEYFKTHSFNFNTSVSCFLQNFIIDLINQYLRLNS